MFLKGGTKNFENNSSKVILNLKQIKKTENSDSTVRTSAPTLASAQHRPCHAEAASHWQRQVHQASGHASLPHLVPVSQLESHPGRGAHVPAVGPRLRHTLLPLLGQPSVAAQCHGDFERRGAEGVRQ